MPKEPIETKVHAVEAERSKAQAEEDAKRPDPPAEAGKAAIDKNTKNE